MSRTPSPFKYDTFHNTSNVTCFLCQKTGHIARNCPSNLNRPTKVAAVSTERSRSRSPQRRVRFEDQKNMDATFTKNDDAQKGKLNTNSCGACLMYTETVSYANSCCDDVKVNRADTDTFKVSTLSPLLDNKSGMTIVKGNIESQEVNVLRDTGCTGVIVKRALVPENSFAGNINSCMMVDKSILELLEARVFLNAPYYTGEVDELCMETPLVDGITSNITGAREPSDLNWTPVLAVQTRAQANQPPPVRRLLNVPDIVKENIIPQK